MKGVLIRKQRTLAFCAYRPHDGSMPSDRSSLQALKNILFEIDLILETTPPLPENRTARSRELLAAAIALTDDLSKQQSMSPAEALGHKGGSATALKHR